MKIREIDNGCIQTYNLVDGYRLKRWCHRCKKYVAFIKVLTTIEAPEGNVESYCPYCCECYHIITKFGPPDRIKVADNIELYCGDCLQIMNNIPTQSIDLILCDLPYGTTRNRWDCPIDFNRLWEQYKRIIKPDGCIALFAQAPFDKVLACSNLPMFRYEWIVEKTKATGHLNAKKCPMKAHENVLIFYNKLPTYNPQMTSGHPPLHSYTKNTDDGSCYGKTQTGISGGGSTERYPRDVLKFSWDTQKSALHPTQKPVALCEYMIKTYTNRGDTVLDNCMGSGSVGVAAMNTGRSFIGIEQDKRYYHIAAYRIRSIN